MILEFIVTHQCTKRLTARGPEFVFIQLFENLALIELDGLVEIFEKLFL